MSTLYRKYRPQSWRDVAGQQHVKTTLAFEVKSGRSAHAYLFSGPRGVGKTTVARILARALNCEFTRIREELEGNPCDDCASCRLIADGQSMDIVEIDAASNRGIDAVRDNVIENSRFAPSSLRRKVFIIDEVHMLTTEAFNALLKTLEEPPDHAVFILATTELHKVPATIISRCQRFDFRKIPFAESVERLAGVAVKEGVELDRETLEEIARSSDGCLRDAESLLGQVVTLGDGRRVTHEEASVVLPRSDWQRLGEYVEALIERDAGRAIRAVAEAVADGVDAAEFADGLTAILRATMLTKLAGEAAVKAMNLDETRRDQLSAWAAAATLPTLVRLTEQLMAKRQECRFAHPPQLPLEVLAVRFAADLEADVPERSTRKHGAKKARPVKAAGAVAPEEGDAAGIHVDADKEPGPIESDKVLSNEARSVGGSPTASEDRLKSPVAGEPEASHPAEATTTATVTFSLVQLEACWPQFVKKSAEFNFSLPYLLGIGRPIEIRGDVAIIGFAFNFHCEKFNSPVHREMMETALEAVLGQRLRLEARLVPSQKPGFPAGEARDAGKAPAVSDELATAFGGEVII